jgi:hypothetical protein
MTFLRSRPGGSYEEAAKAVVSSPAEVEGEIGVLCDALIAAEGRLWL